MEPRRLNAPSHRQPPARPLGLDAALSVAQAARAGSSETRARAARGSQAALRAPSPGKTLQQTTPQAAASRAPTTPPAQAASPDLDALVVRAQAGDRAAFGALVRELQEPLYRSVMRLLRHSPDARDVVQRALLRAWTGLPGLQTPQAFRSWVFSIALNLARNHLRDARGKRFEPVEDARLSVEARAHRALSDHEDRLRLRAALAQLPPRQREVVTLRIDAELSFKAIAEAVGCSEGAARVNFHHGMRRLKDILLNDGAPASEEPKAR